MNFELKIKIKMGNAAFTASAGYEIMRIVKKGLERMTSFIEDIEQDGKPNKDDYPLIDANGNNVGTIEVKVTK